MRARLARLGASAWLGLGLGLGIGLGLGYFALLTLTLTLTLTVKARGSIGDSFSDTTLGDGSGRGFVIY